MDPLVSTDWLAAHGHVHVVDASYYLAEHGRDARAEFDRAHIPGAVFLDLATLADATSPLPMTLPPPVAITARLGGLGIATGEPIVLYDASPLRSAARAWWMLRMAGVANVALLDGGFARWQAEGRPTSRDAPTRTAATHASAVPLATIASFPAMRDIVAAGDAQIVDARSPARFTGAEPETRPGVVPGHIPGSHNLHYATFFAPDGTWKGRDALARLFADAGIDLDRPIVATCGSGVTAAISVFAAHLLGREVALYDGSWTEWGGDPATPKARA